MTYDPPVTHFRDPHDTPATPMTPLRFSWHPCDKRAADTYDTYDTHTNDICSVAILAHVINEKCVHTSSLLSDMNARSDEWLRLHRVDGGARSVFLALSDEAQEAIRKLGGLRTYKHSSKVLMGRIRDHHGWVDIAAEEDRLKVKADEGLRSFEALRIKEEKRTRPRCNPRKNAHQRGGSGGYESRGGSAHQGGFTHQRSK